MIARSLAAIFCCLTAAGPLTGVAQAETGIASVYGYDGQKTANGERANPRGMTAAHKSLPFGTLVTVVNKATARRFWPSRLIRRSRSSRSNPFC